MKNESTLKLSAEIKSKIDEAFSTKEFQEAITNIKVADPNNVGTFEVVITSEAIDRAGEMIKLDGWELDNYLKSPVVLWGHDYSQPPVGICDSLVISEGKYIAKGRFAPTEKGQEIRKLYDLGFLKATSVGFIVKEMQGSVITKAELLEFSFVSVPCNPEALSVLSAKSFNVDELVAKGILIKSDVTEELKKKSDMEIKYENCGSVWDIMNAFFSVYFDESTPVEDFKNLLSETAGLLVKVSNNEIVAQPETSTDSMKQLYEQYAKESPAIKLETKLGAIMDTIKNATLALESLKAKEIAKDLESQKTEEVIVDNPDDAAQFMRKLVQECSTILSEKLSKAKSIKVKKVL